MPSGLAGVTAIAAGAGQSLALKGDGTVVAWGCGGGKAHSGQCNVPSGLSGVTAISAGYGHSLALKGDGTVVAWGCGGGLRLRAVHRAEPACPAWLDLRRRPSTASP